MNQELIDKVTKELLDENQKDSIQEAVSEMIPEFLDDDWADDFDNEYDAYQELGRGEAEGQILNDLIRDKEKVYTIPLDEFCEIYDNLKDEWCL